MSESSRFWNTNGVGDGNSHGYATSVIGNWLTAVFGRGSSGILARVLNELAVSGSASPLSVATGAALVDGLFYVNDAALSLTVTSPTTGTTGGRVVLEADWTAQTVRAKVIKNTDGISTAPAMTQNPGTQYQISLATFRITTLGAITNLVNASDRASFANSPRAEMIHLAAQSVLGRASNSSGAAEAIAASADGQALRRAGTALGFGEIATAGLLDQAVTRDKLDPDFQAATAQLAGGAVGASQIEANSVDDTKLGNRVPQFYRRQGSSSSIWNLAGGNNYTPGAVRVLAGVVTVTISSGYRGALNVTLPVAMATPILLATVQEMTPLPDSYVVGCYAVAVNNTTITITATRNNSWTDHADVTVAWMAIGPEA